MAKRNRVILRELKERISNRAEDFDDFLEDTADRLAEHENTWKVVLAGAVCCGLIGLALGWWFFRGSGCPSTPAPPLAAVESQALPVASVPEVVKVVKRVASGEVKVHAEAGQVVCEVHPVHGVK